MVKDDAIQIPPGKHVRKSRAIQYTPNPAHAMHVDRAYHVNQKSGTHLLRRTYRR